MKITELMKTKRKPVSAGGARTFKRWNEETKEYELGFTITGAGGRFEIIGSEQEWDNIRNEFRDMYDPLETRKPSRTTPPSTTALKRPLRSPPPTPAGGRNSPTIKGKK